MKTLTTIFISILSVLSLASCNRKDTDINESKRYIKFLGGVAEDKAYGMTTTSDGGFIITGTKDELIGDGGHLYVAKVNEFGNYTHTLTYSDTTAFGALKNSEGHDIIQLNNGNYFVLGECTLKNDTTAYLTLELNQFLNIVDQDTILDANKSIGGRKIVQRNDGTLWLSGESTNLSNNDLDLYYMIREADGQISEKKNIGIIDSEDDMGNIITLGDNMTIWCGTNTNTNESSLRTFKLNEDGGILYDFFFKKFNGENEEGHDVSLGTDGNIYHVGSKNNSGYVVVTNTNGVLLREFPITDPNGALTIKAITPTLSGQFIMTGSVTTSDKGDQIFLYRMSSSGNIDLKKYFGGMNDDEGTKIYEMSDGGYVILGTSTIASGNSVLTLIRTDSNGEIFGPSF